MGKHTTRPAPVPYWSEYTACISSQIWAPRGTDSRDSPINTSQGWTSPTAAASWFSTSRMPAPEMPRVYCPSALRGVAASPNDAGTMEQARRIRLCATPEQKAMIATWLEASRWTYNLTVEILQSGIPAQWQHIAKMVMSEVKLLKPEWREVPWQVKRTPVRDACRAMSNVKAFNKQLAEDKAKGMRVDEDFAELGFRSRKNPRQSCYIPASAVSEQGVYHTILGPLRMAEPVPACNKECRLVKERGLYWLVVPHPAHCAIETPSGDGVVALDPGMKTFLAYFSETDCGKIGFRAFGRIQRLCHHLDRLMSRTDRERDHRRRRRMRRAQERMRQRIINLVDELHWQAARWLTSAYQVILLPSFETHDMTKGRARRIGHKTARMLLTFAHYRFRQRLQWKAWQRGALALEVDEAYTSKTRSWDGFVKKNVGNAKTIRDESGFGMDRDINGARGIFLRALGDSPFLRGLLAQVASQPTSALSNVG